MSKQKKGHVFVLSSPSGGGKSTLIQHVLTCFPKLTHSISSTSRLPRETETEGVHYFFLSEEEFKKKIKSGGFAEWAKVFDNFLERKNMQQFFKIFVINNICKRIINYFI